MDDQLKRRLVGVSALLLAALLISLLLPSPGKPTAGEDGLKRVTLDLRQPASAATVTQAAPPSTPVPPVIAAAPPSGAAAESDDAPQFDEPSSDAAGDASVPAGAVTTAPKPEPASAKTKADTADTKVQQHPPAAAPAKPAIAAAVVPQQQASKPAKSSANVQPGAGPSAWFVQAGTFSEVDNARRLAAKLKNGGYAAIVSPAETHAGVGYRVRVGPYRNREQAETAQKGLTQLGVSHAALIGE